MCPPAYPAAPADLPRSAAAPTPLHRQQAPAGAQGAGAAGGQAGQTTLAGELTCVPGARGLVILATAGCHGPGHLATQQLTAILQSHRLATLAISLQDDGASGRPGASDPDRLDACLCAALRRVQQDPRTCRLHRGLMGAADSAAVVLGTAARHPGWVAAVVAQGGRPDPSLAPLARLQAPTLLIVGGRDPELLRLHRSAMRALRCESRLEVVPGASHGFEEPGALETVAHLAASWFTDHLNLPRH